MNVVFNTAKVTSQKNIVAMIPESLQQSDKGVNSFKWGTVKENPGIWGKPDFVKNGFVDLINTIKDTTDYLWHTTSIFVGENEEFLKNGRKPVLLIESKGHALHAFVNQEYQGTGTGNGTHSAFTFKNPISLWAGKNEIALLCLTVGLQTAGPFYECVGAGLTSVKIEGLNNGTVDLSSYAWTYKACLNKNDCVIKLNEENFEANLCPGLSRKLAVEAMILLSIPEEHCITPFDMKTNSESVQSKDSVPLNFQSFVVLVIQRYSVQGEVEVERMHLGLLEREVLACLNKNDCVIKLNEENFEANLCPGLSRKLAVEAMILLSIPEEHCITPDTLGLATLPSRGASQRHPRLDHVAEPSLPSRIWAINRHHSLFASTPLGVLKSASEERIAELEFLAPLQGTQIVLGDVVKNLSSHMILKRLSTGEAHA
ncbi:hypothetical protein Fmac_001189 [Flemingia macrophylla]|uniref:Uncharacterized protein n=1 Tax=Flemingia macrophylla TaxID=520843 RepID=A0ABD1NGE7_9FABA